MLLFARPSDERIRRFLDAQAELEFSYPEVGATAGELPAGYNRHRVEAVLGRGEETFRAAQAALRRWAAFDVSWIELYWPAAPIAPRQTVAVLARLPGVVFLNACRIVYVVDEPRVYGFAYGTLPDHAESGEERFQVAWREDDSVRYEVSAFFRPHHPLVRLTWPLAHWKVNQFRRHSAQAMQRAVAASTEAH